MRAQLAPPGHPLELQRDRHRHLRRAEYDWAGVIFGNDYVWRGDHWEPRPQHSYDPAVKKADGLHFGRLIRNTYKVLLTRGMRGVCVFSEDPETQEYLRTMSG